MVSNLTSNVSFALEVFLILENEEIIRYNYDDFDDHLTNYNGEKIE